MKKFILSIIFFVFLTQFCWADSFLSSPPKWNIGLSYSILVWDSLDFVSASDWGGMVIKYKFSDTWVARGMGAIYSTEEKEKYYFGFGMERHFIRKQFFSFYTGAELAYFWQDDDKIKPWSFPLKGYYDTKEQGFPLELFLGIVCYPWKRISFSIEHTVKIQYGEAWINYYDTKKNWLKKEKVKSITTGWEGSTIMFTFYL